MWWKVVGGLLLLWLVLSVAGAVIGFVVKGVFWLAVIGGVQFVATAAVGYARDKNKLGSNGKKLEAK